MRFGASIMLVALRDVAPWTPREENNLPALLGKPYDTLCPFAVRRSLSSHSRLASSGSCGLVPGEACLNFLIFKKRAPVTPSNSSANSNRKADSAACDAV